ncbi:hypothetical protein IFM89_030970 [Coptis chinensis]|uniref:Replication protein A subunit n=1 Tax=Coptis chinensis TaxID=261450 RepID=A0A835MB39_9MAGN|nr:hypothetical protein IFM89_030970 [Coptis chinensis]
MDDINLTNNAIAMICNGELQAEEDMKPVLQVYDIKLLSAGQQSSNERYRMLLSDGLHSQQSMLATQLNHLIHSGKLQKGSIVRLSQFVSQTIQNRKIIIIIGLDVIFENCDQIGEPKLYVDGPQVRTSIPGQSSVGHPGTASVNPQSVSGSAASAPLPSGSLSAANVIGRASLHQPKPEPHANPQSYGSSFSGNPDSRVFSTTNGPSMYPKAESGARHPQSTSGKYGDQTGNYVNRNEGGSRAPLNTYGRPMPSTYQQPPPTYMNRGPVARNDTTVRTIPIADLNPYQGRWTIKARVTSKTILKSYSNARGEGKVFSFDLLDSEGSEIQATCFNMAAEQFYGMIEAGRVYLISKGSLKPASKTFNHLNNDFCISLDIGATVQPCAEDDDSIPMQQFHFRSIADIENMDNNTMLDVIGVVSSISLTVSIMKKDGTETLKRSLQMKDMSGRSVEVTLWGNFCNAEGQQLQSLCDSGKYPVLAVKAGRINDFNGKAVGTLSNSQLFVNPEIPEARTLREWFDTEGKDITSVSVSRETVGVGRIDVRKTVSQIKDEQLGTSEKPDWITVKATINFIKVDNFCYTACPLMVGERQCNKKVNNNGDGQYRCEKCDQSVAQCDYRYILQFQIKDHTGLTWVTAFQECGEEIIGVSAKELYDLKHEDEDSFGDAIRRVMFTDYVFKLKVKEETFSDEQRVKSTVVKAEKLDVSSESRFLLDMINRLVEDHNAFLGKAANVVMESGMISTGLGVNQASMMNSTGMRTNHVGHGSPYNSTKNAIGGTGVSVFCNSCGGTGHNERNCPSIINRQGHPGVSGHVNASHAGVVSGGSSFTGNMSSVYGSGGGGARGYGGGTNQRVSY